MGAARIMITAKQKAATGVSKGSTFVHQGRIRPMDPSISAIPMNRMVAADRPTTPVCPRAINCFSDNIDLFIPEYRKVTARKAWLTQRMLFIYLRFTTTKLRRAAGLSFDIYQKPGYCALMRLR